MSRYVYVCLSCLAMTALMLGSAVNAASGEEAQGSTPQLDLKVMGATKVGQPLQFSGSSAYTFSATQYLTVFLTPPPSQACPVSAKPPKDAEEVLRHEQVDNYLSITDLSNNLRTAGRWHLCGYLTGSGSEVTASASVPFQVHGSKASSSHHKASPHH